MGNLILQTGAKISPIDPRDWTLASLGAPVIYPSSCFLDTNWMIASMQNQIGCCVGCSGEEIIRLSVYLLTGVKSNPGSMNELSWRFVYAIAKCLEGTSGYEMYSPSGANDGTYPSLVAKIIRTYGVPLSKYCPNDTTLSPEEFIYNSNISNIPAQALTDALTRKSGADTTVPLTQEGIQQALNYALANKGGVMILREVGDTYWTASDGTESWDPSKILPIRVPTQITSGHEEFLTGYDFEPVTNRMRIYWLNHWSPQWADNGRGWEYADVWLPLVKEMRCVISQLPPPPSTFTYHFTQTLKEGMRGPDVVALQHVLQLEGCFPTTQTFTGYFGIITFDSVIKFQEKYASDILTPEGLTKGTGYVGQNTLSKLNFLYYGTRN